MHNTTQILATEQATDRKCPCCGGIMNFNPSAGNLKCLYCDYEEAIPEIQKTAEELDFALAEHTANKNWGIEMKTVLCKACGAQTIYDSLQAAAICPFCGSNQVMETPTEDTIAPGGVIPFRLTSEDAAGRFQKWIRGRWFIPNTVKKLAKAEHFKGIYLPYWTFDAETTSSYRGEYGIDHTLKDQEGSTITTTQWHTTSGSHSEFINDALVIATDRHDSCLLRGLEPFDTERNKTYSPEYLAGFIAERYTTGLKDAWTNAKPIIDNTLTYHIEQAIRQQHQSDHAKNVQFTTHFSNITYKHLLLPVWISHFNYNNAVYQLMVNGQTGKVSCNVPHSKPKIAFTIIISIIIIALLYYLLV